LIIQYKFIKMRQLGPIIPYCVDGNKFYHIPRVQIPLGNSNKQNINPIINNGINKNSISKNVSPKIITKKMVLESCANGCKWP